MKELASDNARRDNFKPAQVATQFACGNASLVTVGANVGVQQDLAVLSEHYITMGAWPMPPFEIPFASTLWATVMWDYVNLPVDHVPMRTGIAARSINFTGLAGRETGVEKW